MPDSGPDIILFDGVCNLCNGFVQFIIRHDQGGRFRFAALQNEVGQDLLAKHGLAPSAGAAELDSVLLLSGGQLYSHSSAVLRIARGLGGGWALVGVGGLLPRT